MRTTELGRTGLTVGVAGLGAGGFSRLGLSTGGNEASAQRVIKTALDSGVNFIDTAAVYGTEQVVGKALKSVQRDDVVISTKSTIAQAGELRPVADVVESLENSLTTLGLDYVDVFHLHAVKPAHYSHVVENVVPALLAQKRAGKFRHLGITETSPNDHGHQMLDRCLDDDQPFEVMMFAHHMMHQSARKVIFPRTLSKGIGTLIMFAVRSIFASPEKLSREVAALVQSGQLSADDIDVADPLGFLVHAQGANSVIDAAYRFCAHEPGADVVLFGTGKPEHVSHNVASINRPPLPATDTDALTRLFGQLAGVGLELPPTAR